MVWNFLVALLLAAPPLGWWLFAVGRRYRFGTALTLVLALGIYVPALASAPLLRQPRSKGRALPVIGVLLMLAAVALRLLAMRELRRHGTSLAPEGWTPPVLVQTGVYRFVRHPIYLSDTLLFFGWSSAWRALRSLWLLGPLFVLAAVARAWLEDRYLHEPAFGEEFGQYQRRTGMLLPKVGRRGTSPRPTAG